MPSRAGWGPVLIVEDDARAAALVSSVLVAASFDVRVVTRGDEAVAPGGVDPCLAVIDVNLPGLSGYEVCRRLRQRYGRALPILFMSGEAVESYDRVAGLLIGGDDYLVKPFAPDELVARVNALLQRVAVRPPTGLTAREQQVLELLAKGMPQREIAQALVISEKTVGSHIEHILGKLGAHSRAEAVAIAFRDDLVSLPV